MNRQQREVVQRRAVDEQPILLLVAIPLSSQNTKSSALPAILQLIVLKLQPLMVVLLVPWLMPIMMPQISPLSLYPTCCQPIFVSKLLPLLLSLPMPRLFWRSSPPNSCYLLIHHIRTTSYRSSPHSFNNSLIQEVEQAIVWCPESEQR